VDVTLQYLISLEKPKVTPLFISKQNIVSNKEKYLAHYDAQILDIKMLFK